MINKIYFTDSCYKPFSANKTMSSVLFKFFIHHLIMSYNFLGSVSLSKQLN